MNIRPSRIDHVQKGTVAGGSEMRWCGEHDTPYVGTCPAHDEEAKDAATYRRGLIDGLREAVSHICPALCGVGLSTRIGGWHYKASPEGNGWVACEANPLRLRIEQIQGNTGEVTA